MRLLANTTFCLAILTATSCCGSMFGRRTGPEFSVAFPDATVLVTTTEPESVRARLANVQLPPTQAHHQQLLELLRAQPKITAPHLMLLVEAVCHPEIGSTVYIDGARHVYPPRGKSEFSKVTDQLLSEGADKLVGLDRRWFGELIGATQSDATLHLLVDRFLPGLDDGSDAALRDMLAGMPGSPAAMPFLTGLAARGNLDGERGWSAVGMLSFDEQRVALVRALAERNASVDGSRLVAIVKSLSFDDGRTKVVEALAAKVKPLSGEVVDDVLGAFSFDAGRKTSCGTFATAGTLRLDLQRLAGLARRFSFDDGRVSCVKTLASCVERPANGDDARQLLQTFSFDSGRLDALRAIAPHCRALSGAAKKELLDAYSFASNREAAAGILLE